MAPHETTSARNCEQEVGQRHPTFRTDPQRARQHAYLRGDGVEQLARDRHAARGQLGKERASYPQTLVDLEGAVDLGVVDESLPSDSSARLFGASCQQAVSKAFTKQQVPR